MVRKLTEVNIPEVPGLVERRLEILAGRVVNWHVISQYHFTDWPRHKIEQNMAKPILKFCKIVRTSLIRSSDRKKQESFCDSALLFGRSRSRTRSKNNSNILLLPEAQKLLL